MLEIQDVTVRYPGTTHAALTSINLKVPLESCTVLLGPNGAGKTTLLRVLAGLLLPTAGNIVLDSGGNAVSGKALRKRVTFAPEGDRSLYFRYTGRENIELALARHGMKTSHSALGDLAQSLGIAHALDKEVRTYSKGMRQKICIMIPLLLPGEVVLLDEPTSGLDSASSMELAAAILQLRRQSKTVIMTTHEFSFAQRCASELAILVGGTIIAAGRCAEFVRLNGVRAFAVRYRRSEPIDLEGWRVVESDGHDHVIVNESLTEDSLAATLRRLIELNATIVGLSNDEPDLASAYQRCITHAALNRNGDPLPSRCIPAGAGSASN